LVLTACDGSDKNKGDLVMTDANNFIYEPTIVLGDIEVEAQTGDIEFDWSNLHTDIRQRPLDPSTVQRLAFIQFNGFTKDELTTKIEKNELYQEDSGEQYLWDNPDNSTSVLVDQFEILGNAFPPEDFVESTDDVWLLSLINIVNGTNDVLQSKFVTPLDASSNLDVAVTDNCSTLDVMVDLTSPPAIEVAAGADTYRAVWSELTTDVNGHTFDPVLASQLQIARYDVATAADVEDIFLQLDTEAAEFYRLDVLGHTGADDLSEATDAAGNHFGGFTTDGVWVVALGCPTCLSPAPLYLAVVDVQ
jgi:hypothetical protein